MKKEEIIYVRIMSVIAASAVMALLLIFCAGSGLFQNIINDMNNNAVDLSSTEFSIYNLYFYKGLNTIYRVLYSVTLFGLILTAAAMFVKLKGAGIYALMSSMMAVVTGVYIVFCNIFESSVGLHRFIVGFYLKETGTIQPAHMLGFSWITGVLLIIVGTLSLFMVKSGRLDKMKAYGGNSVAYLGVMIPVVFGSLFFELIRELVISGVCNGADSYMQSAYVCVKDYYFADAWFFDWPYVICLIFTALGVIFLKKAGFLLSAKKYSSWLIPLIFTAAGIIRSVVYYLNAPPLFGYLTMDEKLCDLIEGAYPAYMIVSILDMVFLMTALVLLLEGKSSFKKILTACGINIAVSVIAIVLLGHFAELGSIYAGCAAADIIGLLCCLYPGNIRRSHH